MSKQKSKTKQNTLANQQAEKVQYALLLQNRGQFEMAEFIYKEAIKNDKNYIDAHYLLGMLYLQKEDHANAIDHFQHALRLAPNNPLIHFNLGTVLCHQKNFSQALAYFDNAIALKVDYAEAYCNKANALMDLGVFEDAARGYELAIKFHPNLAEAHCNMGIALNTLRKPEQALKRLNQAIQLIPNYAEAYYHKGNSLVELQLTEAAIQNYQKAISLRPDYGSAKYALAALTQENPPATAPSDYVENLFDHYAEKFDAHLTQVLEYKTPYELASQLKIFTNRRNFTALDLGCGTGLCALAFAGVFNSIDGVDLSRNMVNKAAERNIYKNLYAQDIIEYLQKEDASYDLLICADVLVYIGDLTNVFDGAKKAIKEKGFFSFSVELNPQKSDFTLNPSMRYGHSTGYVTRIAQRFGFKILDLKECRLRKDAGQWIMGNTFLLQS